MLRRPRRDALKVTTEVPAPKPVDAGLLHRPALALERPVAAAAQRQPEVLEAVLDVPAAGRDDGRLGSSHQLLHQAGDAVEAVQLVEHGHVVALGPVARRMHWRGEERVVSP